MIFSSRIPGGTADYPPEECGRKRAAENKLRNLFFRHGYDEIQTPSLEYYDGFVNAGVIRPESMIKLIDEKGDILVLRPDQTAPAVRLAASRLRGEALPLRLSYISELFAFDWERAGRQREFTQAGVELIGASGADADAEMIILAIDSMLELGLEGVQIDLGQVSFFTGIMEDMGLDAKGVETVRELVDSKNMLQLEFFLESISAEEQAKEIIRLLPTLYGGIEVLDEAARLGGGRKINDAIENLHSIYDILKEFGYDKYISFDLGMVQRLNYYTGIIFRGMTERYGLTLLSGGRYDNLLSNYGYDAPATGFAIGINRALHAAELQGTGRGTTQEDIIAGHEPGARSAAIKLMRALRADGRRVSDCMAAGEEALLKYAEGKDVKEIIYILRDGSVKKL